uniref:Uncharacterized protein n=1 Tax=Siphoviridae sp. ctxrg1 TaxID=2825741 RepID=A0A8S5Q619_9CAUD|nr:MAG TPA: hypothetical protein [Siphoviridae sp. ctxrg1]
MEAVGTNNKKNSRSEKRLFTKIYNLKITYLGGKSK